MTTSNRSVLRASCMVLCLFGALQSCAAPAPRVRAESSLGEVRARSEAMAKDVARMVEELGPRVLELVPDTRERELDVWVQESPTLYRWFTRSYEEADGFWAERPSRIHLREGADDIRRTLAHELVHATLGESWHVLPGTIEEGLCDLVSIELCPEGAPLMRAGRLSAASFALGGLELELELAIPKQTEHLDVELTYVARILLQSNSASSIVPSEVFDVRAGLSSTRMPAADKKAFYGLSYVVVSRIVERSGIEGLHALCLRASDEGLEEVPGDWLLDAAGLDDSVSDWHTAITSALGPPELAQLVRMYPNFLAEALRACGRSLDTEGDSGTPRILQVGLGLPDSGPQVTVAAFSTGELAGVAVVRD